MSTFTVVYLIVVLVLVVVFLGSSYILSRGRRLKCPECGNVFRAPMFDEKISGLGLTFPYMGRVKCPKCGVKRGRRDYLAVKSEVT
ncbi:MAG: hypothetical protein QW688_08785 [Thermoprotei archaeon]